MRTCVRMLYVELHAHSAFSFLDGASLPSELAGAASQLGYEAFALTDHNGVYGSMEFAQAAKAVGALARHVTLLVRHATGWANLCRLLTHAHAHTRAPEGGPIVDAPRVTLDDLE